MFIQTQDTPNPKAIKFHLEQELGINDPVTITRDDLAKSNLAKQLFDFSNVTIIFVAKDFITINIDDSLKWPTLKPQFTAMIMDYLLSGMPIINKDDNIKTHKKLSEIEEQIVELIEHRVRPSVAMDGGDIIFKEYKDGVVYVELNGACKGCPSSTITLKQGIETMLQHYIPEITEVVALENV